MRYRRIAGTDIAVSEVGFGVWTVSSGWWGEFTDAQAVSLLRQARDLGITRNVVHIYSCRIITRLKAVISEFIDEL